MPLPVRTKSKPKASSGWSDSEDEKPKARVVKKMRSGNRCKVKGMRGGEMMFGDGLKSPFEEREFSF
jgi:hypothetical protein